MSNAIERLLLIEIEKISVPKENCCERTRGQEVNEASRKIGKLWWYCNPTQAGID